MSLKQRLHTLLKANKGQPVSLNTLEGIVKGWHYKLATAERKLRPSESPDVEGVMINRAIIAYRWKGDCSIKNCCESFRLIQIHARNCPTLAVELPEDDAKLF